MKNLKVEVKKNIMTITVDLSKTQGASKSGKNMIIATTGGNKPVMTDSGTSVTIGLNIYKDIEE